MAIEQQHNPNYDIPGVAKAGEEPKRKTPVIETYASDMAEAIRTEEASVIKAALAEEKKRELEEAEKSPTSPKNKTYIIGGAVLVLVAIVILIIVVSHAKNPKNIPVTPSQVQTLVFADTNKEINATNLSKEQIAAAVSDEIKTTVIQKNKIENISFIKNAQPEDTVKFFASIGSTATPALLRALGNTFMLGIHNTDTADKHLFLILPVVSRDQAVQGMNLWEKNMLDNLFLIFGTDVAGPRANLFQTKFTDDVVQNLNARALKDDTGNTVLMYVFANDSTIVITDNSNTLSEVLNRLRAQKSVPVVPN